MAEAAPAGRRLSPATIALALAALIALAALSYALFFRNRGAAPDGNEAAANAAAPADLAAALEARAADLVERLRADPDNHEGWYALGLTYRQLERFPEAALAFRRAMELAPRNADYTAYLAEMLLIQSTRSRQPPPPEADLLLRRTLEIQPGNPQARFYLATIRDLRGDHRGAIDDLIALLRDAPPGEVWPQQVRQSVLYIAQQNNIDVTGRLPALPAGPAAPPAPSAATAAIPGPTPEQMQAASAMTPSQQEAASRAMVERLAARLTANPRDEQGWIMLMRSRMVLQDRNGAAEALRSALGAFQNDAAAQARLRQAARELGVPAG